MVKDGTQVLDIYEYQDPGYRPLLVMDGWILACLNYLEEANPQNMANLERHLLTQEVFILVKGEADLILARDNLQCISMEQGKAYSIREGVWHGLAMRKGSQCFIVKNPHPLGKKDVEQRDLTITELDELRKYYKLQ